MKIKVSETTEEQLDWLVAKAAGYTTSDLDLLYDIKSYDKFNPSTDWAIAGPIIEREEIGTKRNAPCSKGREWEASPSITAKGAGGRFGYGPTPLIAAMRCYCASRLGEVVEVPEELCR